MFVNVVCFVLDVYINNNKNVSQQTSSSKNVVSRSVLRDPVAGSFHVTSFTQRNDYEFGI